MSLHRSIHPAKGGGGACFHLRSAWKLLAILFGLLVVATSAAVSATEKTLAEEEPILDHVMANSHEQQMHRQAQFGWISDLLRPDVSDATACTAFEIANDDCIYRNDGECDAGREEFCGIGTDCVDCDPCRARTTTSCDECVNGDNSDNGENNSTACVWCITSTGAGVCSSTTLAEALPLICSPDGGVTNSTFFDTCTDVEAVTPNVTIATDVPAPTPTYTCDGTIDTCQSANDGVCDKSFFTCRGTNSDCDNGSLPGRAVRLHGMVVRHGSSQASLGSSYTGAGIGIRINDNGVDSSHPDFSSKFDAESSCQISTPFELSLKYNHGTACASLAAGSADGSCAVGLAPDATLSACRVYSGGKEVTPEQADSSFFYVNMETMHISSNSFGPDTCTRKTFRRERRLQSCPFSATSPASPCVANACSGQDWSSSSLRSSCEEATALYCRIEFQNDVQACTASLDRFAQCEFDVLSEVQDAALVKGIAEGRDGKGIIFLVASGNDHSNGADVNHDGMLTSRFVLSVGAVGKDGVHSYYSITGAALFVSAPGGNARQEYTTNMVAMAGGGCTDALDGTSFACPVVSGIVALMLQANNALTWRDVRGIIASSSQQAHPDDPSWTMNAAGFRHSYLYGFGVVDATAAVNAARTWANFNNETEILGESGALNLTIPEFPSETVESTISLLSTDTFAIETVNVYLDLVHSSRGHVEITLVSPQGTEAILSPGSRPENNQETEPWRLASVRSWGESANGEWTLRLVDRREGDVASCIDLAGWSTIYDAGSLGQEELGCFDFASLGVCVDGVSVAPELTMLTDSNGVSSLSACCACGGGQSVTNVTNTLKSWRLAVYGHDGTLAPAVPGPDAPLVVAPNGTAPTATATNTNGGSTLTPDAPFSSPNSTGGSSPEGSSSSSSSSSGYAWIDRSMLVLLFLGALLASF